MTSTSSFMASAHPTGVLELTEPWGCCCLSFFLTNIAKPRGLWEQDEIMRMRIGWFLAAILPWTVRWLVLSSFAQKTRKRRGNLEKVNTDLAFALAPRCINWYLFLVFFRFCVCLSNQNQSKRNHSKTATKVYLSSINFFRQKWSVRISTLLLLVKSLGKFLLGFTLTVIITRTLARLIPRLTLHGLLLWTRNFSPVHPCGI